MTIAKEVERQRLKAMNATKEGKNGFKAEEYWLNKKGCPLGTVPIRRMSKKQLKTLERHEYFDYNWIDFAGITVKATPQTPPTDCFFGASAYLCLYNPQVNGDGEYSASAITLQKGVGYELEQIQVGWIVHPNLNGDSRTRMYTTWTVSGYQKTGCYNTRCPGFVQVSAKIPIDYAFPHTSVIQSDHKEEVLLRVTQNEYFDYQLEMPDMGETIGMWPFKMFKKLVDNGADTVRYEGKVYTPAGQYSSPQMGSGRFRGGIWQLTCYMRKVLYEIVVNGQNTQVPPDQSIVETHESRCFYEGYEHNDNDGYWDYNFLFGGKGGEDEGRTCQYIWRKEKQNNVTI